MAGTGGDPGYRVYYTDWTGESFAYDANGNRTRETTTGYHNVDNDSGEAGLPKYQPGLRTTTAEDATVTWDALNRMTNFSDTGANLALPPTTIAWEYDLNSNIRYMTASYQAADGSGTTAQTYWYKYDAMNRFVTTKGTLTGARGSGSITVGTGSVISYDAAGHRATVTDASSAEVYSYTADGYLAQVTIGGVLRAKYALDASGRALAYSEYNAAGTSVVYSRTAVYDAVSNVTSDSVTTVRTDGTYVAASTYSYGTPVYHAGTFSYSFDGAYQGVVSQIVTTNTKNGSAQPTSEADYFYDWRDSAVEGTESYTANTAVSAPVANYSGYNYGLGGRLQSVVIDDGHPRTITFGTNIEGQILSRAENDNVGGTVDQYERHFYFDGMALGDVSNNGTSDTDYAASIAAHIAVPGSGNLRGGATVAMPYADFDQSYDPVNGITYAGAPSHYTAQDGDTLAGIAAMVWGDASLWYLIADANGLSSPGDSLTAGTDLILPNKVVNLHNNAGTFKVYDPNEAIGDTAPTVPKQPKHDNGCGVLGQVLLAVVAIVVAAVTYGALAGPMSTFAASTLGLDAGVVSSTTAAVAGTASAVAVGSDAAIAGAVMAGAIGGVAGSVISQGVGLATGIQNSFNWNAVGLAAIGGAIGGGLGPNALDAFGGATGSSFVNAALRGVAGGILTEGIGVATGLQKKFDWTGVAAAGIGAGVGEYIGDLIGSRFNTGGSLDLGSPAANQAAVRFVSGMAGDIANAATRTLINGSDFGDNLIAALPDTIGQTIGNSIAGQIAGSGATDDDPYASERASWVRFAGPGAAPPKQDEGFFGWLGDEISTGWHALVSGGETIVNDASEAFGGGPVFDDPNVETVVVEGARMNQSRPSPTSWFNGLGNLITEGLAREGKNEIAQANAQAAVAQHIRSYLRAPSGLKTIDAMALSGGDPIVMANTIKAFPETAQPRMMSHGEVIGNTTTVALTVVPAVSTLSSEVLIGSRILVGSTEIEPAFLQELKGGGSWLMTEDQYYLYAKDAAFVGRQDGQFLTSARQMNELIDATGGDPALLGEKLGVSSWSSDTPLVRIDIPDPLSFNPRLPDSALSGANTLFEPGGLTSGGAPEVAIDPVPGSQIWATPLRPHR